MDIRGMRAVVRATEPRLNRNAVSQIVADMRCVERSRSIADIEAYVHEYLDDIRLEEERMHRHHPHIPMADPVESLNEHADELAYEAMAS